MELCLRRPNEVEHLPIVGGFRGVNSGSGFIQVMVKEFSVIRIYRITGENTHWVTNAGPTLLKRHKAVPDHGIFHYDGMLYERLSEEDIRRAVDGQIFTYSYEIR